MSKYSLCLSFFLVCSEITAGPIIVTADQFERVYLDSTSSIELITREQIEASPASSVIDLLKSKVGLSIPTNGPFGKASSIQIRGADSRHTLVLIDGVRATDVTSISGGARLEFLGLDQIESIEILRGSQSVLYGSEAIGGVLKITTLKPQEKKSKLKISYGSYNNRMGSASLQGKNDLNGVSLGYILGTAIQRVDGISAFNEARAINADKDGLNQTHYLTKVNVGKGKHSLSMGAQATLSHYEYDDASADNPTSVGDFKDLQLFGIYTYRKDPLTNISLSYTQKKIDRELSGVNSFGKFGYFYEGNFKRVEIKNKIKLIENGDSIFGIELERESVDALDTKLDETKRRERVASYINHYQQLNNLLFEAGVRVERFQGFNNEFVYRTSLGYKFGKITLKGSYATGFKAPSLYQSFNTFAPSKEISYEESKSSELGILYVSSHAMFEMTAFEIEYDNFIDFDSPLNRYVNRGDFLQRGIELSIEKEIGAWEIDNTYTFLKSENKETFTQLVRRPKHKLNSSMIYNFNKKLKAGSQFDFVGKRNEVNNQKLPSYWTLGMLVMKKLSTYEVKLSLNNILNRKYEEVLYFPAQGRSFLLSLSGEWP